MIMLNIWKVTDIRNEVLLLSHWSTFCIMLNLQIYKPNYHTVKSIQISLKIYYFFMAFYGKQSWIRKIHSRVTFVFYLTNQVRQVSVAGTQAKYLPKYKKFNESLNIRIHIGYHFLNYKLYLQNKTSCYPGEEWRWGRNLKHCLRCTYVQLQLWNVMEAKMPMLTFSALPPLHSLGLDLVMQLK